jgi:hypothetical protein
MTIRLFLNLPLNLILQKTTKPNLPQSFPNIPLQLSLTLSYNVYLVSPHTHTQPSHTPTQYSPNLPTSHTIFIHTLIHLVYTYLISKYTHYSHNHLFATHTSQLTISYHIQPMYSLTQISYIFPYTLSHPIHTTHHLLSNSTHGI